MRDDAEQYPARLRWRADPAGVLLIALAFIPAGVFSVIVDLCVQPVAPGSQLLGHVLAFAAGILPGMMLALSALRVRVDVSHDRIAVRGLLFQRVIRAADVVALDRIRGGRALALTARDNAPLLLYRDKSDAAYEALVARLSAQYGTS